MSTLCGLFGISRQAYYQQRKRTYKEEAQSDLILKFVKEKRVLMPKIGGKKLRNLSLDELPVDLHLGRDAFFDLLRENKLLVKPRRYRVKTTDSNHWLHKYPNLIKEFSPNRPHQLWVSDITYVETNQGFKFLFLITDAYSRKIIGWCLGDTLEAKYAVKALSMALWQLPDEVTDIIHHSDRGVQYCSEVYVKKLKKRGIKISMTENGDPLENAIAERINGILKTEWLYDLKLKSKVISKKEIARIIEIYNTQRPHSSLDMMKPEEAHKLEGNLKKHWKNYYKKRPVLEIEQ